MRARYTKKLRNKLVESYAEGKYSILEVCKMHGISKQTWYDWKERHVDFLDLLKKAEEEREENHYEAAITNYWKLLNGYEYEEVTQIGRINNEGEIVSKYVKKTEKHVQPNPTLVMFTLKTKRPDLWPERHQVEHSGRVVTKVHVEHAPPIEMNPDEL